MTNLYRSKVWVKLSKKGLTHLEQEAKSYASFLKDPSGEETWMNRYRRQDGWFEFNLHDFIITFKTLFATCEMEPLEDGNMHFECPY